MLGNRKTRWLSALVSGSIGLMTSFAMAEPAEAPLRGEIKSFTTAPKGETDGAMLTDGSYLHWPPHAGERIAAIVKVGDRLEAEGRWEAGPEGDRRFEAERVTNTKSEESVEIDRPRRGPRGERGPRGAIRGPRGETTEKVGRIKELTKAPRGEIDGAVLDDGTTIHWPPHLEDRFRAIATVGAEVRAVGTPETTPRGDSHFEVRSLTNLESNQTVANDEAPVSPRHPKESRDERLRELQRQLDRIQQELDELRRAE